MSAKTASKNITGVLMNPHPSPEPTLWEWRSDTDIVGVNFLDSEAVWSFPRGLILPVVNGGRHLLADLIEAPVIETEPKDSYTPWLPEMSNADGSIHFSYIPERTYESPGYDMWGPDSMWNNADKIVMRLTGDLRGEQVTSRICFKNFAVSFFILDQCVVRS